MLLIEKFHHLLQEIQELQLPVVVEGKKDRLALHQLGLTSSIILTKPLYQVIEELSAKEIVILTDLDREGKVLYSKLYQECLHRGIKVNNRLRTFLLQETPLSHIQGLPRFLRNLEIKEGIEFPILIEK